MGEQTTRQDERERNKQVIRRLVQEVQNDKSEDAYWELNDPTS